MRLKGNANPSINEYSVNVVPAPASLSCGHSMLHVIFLLSFSMVVAYSITGNIITADVVHAMAATIFATNGDRYRVDDTGWHTAMYRSGDSIRKEKQTKKGKKD